VRADKTRKLLITERRRRITRVCHGRATSNALHSDRTGTEAAATASSATDNRVVGRRRAAVSTHGKRGRKRARAHLSAVGGRGEVRVVVIGWRSRAVREEGRAVSVAGD